MGGVLSSSDSDQTSDDSSSSSDVSSSSSDGDFWFGSDDDSTTSENELTNKPDIINIQYETLPRLIFSCINFYSINNSL